MLQILRFDKYHICFTEIKLKILSKGIWIVSGIFGFGLLTGQYI